MLKARTLLMVASLGLATALALPATAQNWDGGWRQDRDRWGWAQDRDYDRDHDRYNNSSAYQDGYRDGMRDRDHNRGWHPNGNRWRGDERRAYDAGYKASFSGRGGYGDRDRDRDRDNGRWGSNVGNYGGRGGYGGEASRIGYQDGLDYGQRDASRGKGYNATGSENYERADRGYNSSFGDKNSYRQSYRQAYQEGYRAGYYGRGGRR